MELFKLFGTIAIENSDANNAIDETTDKAQSLSQKMSDRFTDIGRGATSLAGKFTDVGDRTTQLGKGMSLGFTAPLTLLGKKAIQTTADFESAMSEVSAISGATGDDLVALENKAKQMGKTTKFSASESAEALKYMAMAGWKTEDMLSGLEGIMNLAAASGEDLGTTSDIVTDALTAFGMSASESGHFADVLARASSNANTNVVMMGETFKYVAPVAGALGYSAEDVSLAIGLMANSSIKSSQAGTSLRSSLTRLSGTNEAVMKTMVSLGLATAETAEVFDEGKIEKAQAKVANKTIDMEKAQIKYNDAVGKYGESSSQAQTAALNLEKAENNLQSALNDLDAAYQGNIEVQGYSNDLMFKSDGTSRSLRDVILDLREKFSTLSEEEQLNAAAVLFGQEAMSGMLAVINASDEDFDKLVASIDSADGAAKEMADTMNDNLSGQITLLKSQLEGLAIQFVTLIMPYLKQGVEWLSKVCDWISGLDDGTKKMIMTVAAVLAAAGPVLIFLGKVSSGIGLILQVGGKLVGGIGRLSSIIPGVISVGGKAVEIGGKVIGIGGKLIGGIGSLVGKIAGVLIPAISSVGAPVLAVIAVFGALVAAGVLIYKNWDEICAWAWESWGKIQDIIGGAVEGILNFFGGLKDGFLKFTSFIGDKAGELKDKVVNKAKEMKDGAVEKFQELKDGAVEKFESLKESVVEKAGSLKEKAVSKFQELKEKAVEKVESLREKAAEKFESLKEKATEKVESLKEKAVSKFEELREKAGDKVSSLKDRAVDIFNSMREKGLEGFEGLKSGALERFERLKSGISEKLDAVRDFTSKVVQKLKDFFKFEWKLPKIKLPHFSISGKFSLNPPSIPHFSVEWYKKAMEAPMILDKPTAFGINRSGQIMAGGEAGSEVVSGTEKLMDMISAAVAENNERLYELLEEIYRLLARYLPDYARLQVVLDTEALVGELAGPIDEELGWRAKVRERCN